MPIDRDKAMAHEFPSGEIDLTSYWLEADRVLIEAKIKELDASVISNACILLCPTSKTRSERSPT